MIGGVRDMGKTRMAFKYLSTWALNRSSHRHEWTRAMDREVVMEREAMMTKIHDRGGSYGQIVGERDGGSLKDGL